MPEELAAGPFRFVDVGAGIRAPWYIIPFDKHAATTAPHTTRELIRDASTGEYSDIFLFSHGWNNDWAAASARYEDFIRGYVRMREGEGLSFEPSRKTLLVGIFWPSTALVFPWEKVPEFAGAPTQTANEPAEDFSRMIEELCVDVTPADREQFLQLAQQTVLDSSESLRFAEILTSALARYHGQDVTIASPLANPAELVQLWRRVPGKASTAKTLGEFGLPQDMQMSGPTAAGWDLLDPRKALRVATVLQMKDRAGIVGRDGVGPLLRDIVRSAPAARVHLIGHSYGAIVLLSALCAGVNDQTRVTSMLLLQAAVSRWCFSSNVTASGFAGGYASALERVAGRIFATYSKNDIALRKLFHLAVRRERDLGQPQAASSALPAAPSDYAALGGYGPAGLGSHQFTVVEMTDPPSPYVVTPETAKVCALAGDSFIGGHGDISNSATWWALYQQVHQTIQ